MSFQLPTQTHQSIIQHNVSVTTAAGPVGGPKVITHQTIIPHNIAVNTYATSSHATPSSVIPPPIIPTFPVIHHIHQHDNITRYRGIPIVSSPIPKIVSPVVPFHSIHLPKLPVGVPIYNGHVNSSPINTNFSDIGIDVVTPLEQQHLHDYSTQIAIVPTSHGFGDHINLQSLI